MGGVALSTSQNHREIRVFQRGLPGVFLPFFTGHLAHPRGEARFLQALAPVDGACKVSKGSLVGTVDAAHQDYRTGRHLTEHRVQCIAATDLH